MYVCTYIFICIYIYVHIYVRTYVVMYLCVYVRVYLCMSVCMYVCTSTYLSIDPSFECFMFCPHAVRYWCSYRNTRQVAVIVSNDLSLEAVERYLCFGRY